jgi:NAD(P)-dependent dehydrogenase (short-subunit alcohol dehydrogenase family)
MARSVLVTGANRGLGIEFARQMRARGDHVIAAVRSASSSGVGDLKGIGVDLLELDVSSESSIAAAAKTLGSRPIDVLVNNAGVMGDDKSLETSSFDEFRRVFETNVYGAVILAQSLVANLKAAKGSMVLNISSELGSIAQATGGFSWAYCSSKSALNMLTKLMAADLREHSVRVYSFCPGWNKTDMGGPSAPLDPRESIAKLLASADRLTMQETGSYRRIDGSAIPY